MGREGDVVLGVRGVIECLDCIAIHCVLAKVVGHLVDCLKIGCSSSWAKRHIRRPSKVPSDLNIQIALVVPITFLPRYM